MKASIKQVSLALLFCTSTTYGMENNVVISIDAEPFTMNDMLIPNDVLKNIFMHVYLNKVIINHIDNVNAVAEITKEIRSVCKHWHRICDPVTVRKLLNWNPIQIAYFLNTTSASWSERYSRYKTFLASTLKDQPDLIPLHTTSILDAKIALTHGANPNKEKDGYTPLLYALEKNNMKIFTLLLDHGGNVNRSLLFEVFIKSGVWFSIFFGFVDHLIGRGLYKLGRPSVWHTIIRWNLPAKNLCSLMTSITVVHLVCVCPTTNQWPLTAILKNYWKNLATLNRF